MASLLNRKAVKTLALEEAKKVNENLTRVSPDFLAKVEAGVQKFVVDYLTNNKFTGKTVS